MPKSYLLKPDLLSSPEERAAYEREVQTQIDDARKREENGTWHLCDDCGVDTQDIGEQYMVHDGIWTDATGVL
jgi:hypothetical protein